MKSSEYLIVHKSILSEEFEQVIEIKELINHQNLSVSQACKIKNVSRSTYYKYKDYVFRPTSDVGHVALFTLQCKDEKGILSKILKCTYDVGGNIISINQNAPMQGVAVITMTIKTDDLNCEMIAFKELLAHLTGIINVDIVGVE